MSQSPKTSLMTLKEMHTDLVWVRQNQLVARRSTGRVLRAAEMAADLAASTTGVGKKDVRTFGLWQSCADRVTVDTQTWDPAEPQICGDPEAAGTVAFNAWTGLPAYQAPEDWEARARAFVDHVAYLVPEPKECRQFLTWLAHIVQKPGELPHSYYVLISRKHGTGRNWLASVLARVLKGYVSPSLDLGQLIHGGFNGAIAKKLLAIVDEAHEGMEGRDRFANAKTLRRIVTEEWRLVNPKCLPQYMEKNALRWLMFSNYEDPLPIDAEDRRGNFIQGPSVPREPAYYERLYQDDLADPEFIASVRHYLQTLDISTFNAGAHSTRNAMRERVINAGKSELERAVEEIVTHYTGGVIRMAFIRSVIANEFGGEDKINDKALTYACRRAGISPTGKKLKMNGHPERISILSDKMSAVEFEAITSEPGYGVEMCDDLHEWEHAYLNP